MNQRTKILHTMLCLLLALPLIACRAERPRVFTIGILNLHDSLEQVVESFQATMTQMGYLENQTIHYRYQGPSHDAAALTQVAQALVAEKVDLIFALGTSATMIAQAAVEGTHIPVLFAPLNDPLSAGFVETLTHPGGNLTGVTTGGYVPKELEWLLRLAPQTKQIFVPHHPQDEISVQTLATLQHTAARFRVELLVQNVTTTDEVINLNNTMPATADAILILPTPLLIEQMDTFVALSQKRKVPLAAPSLTYVTTGALVAYGTDYKAVGAQVSRLADKILQGVAPADLPVETAQFYLGINLQAAKAIELAIPDVLVQQAHLLIR
ncbi:MAG: ABC transporter substrate-binding protein [Caldilineaceae bacterium]|nr:ABC transporter substrate-binding protein [Caldilineaceae bacterium]